MINDVFIHYPNYDRDDKYGGSLRGRLQWEVEFVKGVKKACGPNFAVINRFCLKQFMKGDQNTFAVPGETLEEYGRDIPEAMEAAKILKEAGYDGIDGLGDSVSLMWSHPSMYFKSGYTLPYYKQFREGEKDLALICLGHLEDPYISAKAIEEGYIDFAGIAKQLLADPEYVNKIANKIHILFAKYF